MKLRRYLLAGVSGLALGLYQSTFLTFAHGWLGWFHPSLIAIVILILLEKRGYALTASVGAGLAQDLFAVESSSFALLRYLSFAGLSWFLAERVLTNRSLYSALALMAGARLLDFVWLYFAAWLLTFFGRPAYFFPGWGSLPGIALADALAMLLMFLFGTYGLRKIFRPRRVLSYVP